MSKIFRLSLAVSSLFFSYLLLSVYAQEDITITTYYPAPYGVYHRMQSDEVTIGEGYRDNTPPVNGMIIQGRLGVGRADPRVSLDVTGDVRISGELRGKLACEVFHGPENPSPSKASCENGFYVISGYCSGTNEHVSNIGLSDDSITCTANDGSDSNVHPHAICCRSN